MLTKRDFLAYVAAIPGIGAVVDPAAAPPSNKVTGPPSLDDLMPDFWFWYEKESKNPSTLERVRSLGINFFLPHSFVFTAAGFNGGSHGRFKDDRVAKWLTSLDLIAYTVRSISAITPDVFYSMTREFFARFGSVDLKCKTIIAPSLFEFNAAARQYNGEMFLFLSPDGVVHLGGKKRELQVAVGHELTHVYYQRLHPEFSTTTVWSRLFAEGLAVYVSRLLVKGSSDDAALMSMVLGRVPRERFLESAKFCLMNIDSSDPSIMSKLFDVQDRAALNSRIGYLVGYRVISALSTRYGIAYLLHLHPISCRDIFLNELLVQASS